MPRPVASGVLTIIGGFFILVGGFLLWVVGFLVSAFAATITGHFHLIPFFVVGMLVGFLTMVIGALMLAVPSGHVVWGIVAIVLGILSIPFALLGLGLGLVLTVLGGILAILWKPPTEPAITVEARPVMPPPPA